MTPAHPEPESNDTAHTRTRVFVADDGSIVCNGLIAALTEIGLLEIVKVEFTASRILESVRRVTPDVVIIPLWESGTVPLIRQVRDASSESTAVLVIGENGPLLDRSIGTGAAAVLSWRATVPEVSLAVIAATTGEPAQARRRPSADGGLGLSGRELEVMRLAAEGLTNSSAARALHLSEATVKTYWRRVFRKLDVHDRTTAVAAAISAGALPVRAADPAPFPVSPCPA